MKYLTLITTLLTLATSPAFAWPSSEELDQMAQEDGEMQADHEREWGEE